jgi:leucyl aminopeptidase (aminopeptidase T)
VLRLEFRDALLHFVGGRLRRFALGLFPKKFLIDETVEGAAAILIGDLAEGPSFQERFEAHGVIPIALQDDVTIHSGDNAIDDVASMSDRNSHRHK